jgi:hypothetical protein
MAFCPHNSAVATCKNVQNVHAQATNAGGGGAAALPRRDTEWGMNFFSKGPCFS